MTLPVVLAIAGCVALLVGLLGGGIKGKEIEVPTLSGVTRFFSGLVGVALIGVATWFSYAIPSQPSTIAPEPTATGISPTPLVLNLRPSCGSEYTVESGKTVELHYGGWYAKGLTLATDNANHLTVTLFIDGQMVSGIKQEIQQVTTSWYPGASCGSKDYSDAFGIFYIANIGTFTPGKHAIQVIYSFDKQVTDGYDDNGTPNIYGPGELDPIQFTIVSNP